MVGVVIGPFDVQNEARLAKKGRFKVVLGLSAFRDAPADFVELWGRNSKRDRKTRLKCVLVPHVAYLINVGFDQLESVSLDYSTPLAQEVVDTTSGGPNPVQLEVEACCGIVNDVVVQDNGFSLVALLWHQFVSGGKVNGGNMSIPSSGRRQ